MVKKMKVARTHPQNIPAAAYCCLHHNDVGARPSFSLWAEFCLFPWWDCKYLIEKIFET
jgi:hypothetical protein